MKTNLPNIVRNAGIALWLITLMIVTGCKSGTFFPGSPAEAEAERMENLRASNPAAYELERGEAVDKQQRDYGDLQRMSR